MLFSWFGLHVHVSTFHEKLFLSAQATNFQPTKVLAMGIFLKFAIAFTRHITS